MSTSSELRPVVQGESEMGQDSGAYNRMLRVLERIERNQAALVADFNMLHQAMLQLQADVNFFTKRCETRGNAIREFIARVRENGGVEQEAALEFLGDLECAGTPVRPPTGSGHPAVRPLDEEPTDPGK